jgi:uncharacterized protein YxjI
MSELPEPSMSPPANWYRDPMGRHEFRYWDGTTWTDHVSNGGQASVDPVHAAGSTLPSARAASPMATTTNESNRVREQVAGTGMRGAGIGGSLAGGGTLFTEPVLVVNQKAKLIELTNQYKVFNSAGTQIAAVNQVGQSKAKKALRVLTSLDQFMTHQLHITDAVGAVQMTIVRPAKLLKSTVIVNDAHGNEIGRIVQQNAIGKIRFGLEAGGQQLGMIKAENWRAWNFSIEDATGAEVARITKTWEGLGKTMFTTADNYVVKIHGAIPQPLLSLVVASALSVDTALKQDSRGFG